MKVKSILATTAVTVAIAGMGAGTAHAQEVFGNSYDPVPATHCTDGERIPAPFAGNPDQVCYHNTWLSVGEHVAPSKPVVETPAKPAPAKPVAKPAPTKPVVKAPAKPVVKHVAPKPVVKHVAAKPVVKHVAAKPVVKHVAAKPASAPHSIYGVLHINGVTVFGNFGS